MALSGLGIMAVSLILILMEESYAIGDPKSDTSFAWGIGLLSAGTVVATIGSIGSLLTTAYMADYQRNVYKMPIMVEVTMNSFGGMTMRVSQKYVNTRFGGRWDKIYSGGEY